MGVTGELCAREPGRGGSRRVGAHRVMGRGAQQPQAAANMLTQALQARRGSGRHRHHERSYSHQELVDRAIHLSGELKRAIGRVARDNNDPEAVEEAARRLAEEVTAHAALAFYQTEEWPPLAKARERALERARVSTQQRLADHNNAKLALLHAQRAVEEEVIDAVVEEAAAKPREFLRAVLGDDCHDALKAFHAKGVDITAMSARAREQWLSPATKFDRGPRRTLLQQLESSRIFNPARCSHADDVRVRGQVMAGAPVTVPQRPQVADRQHRQHEHVQQRHRHRALEDELAEARVQQAERLAVVTHHPQPQQLLPQGLAVALTTADHQQARKRERHGAEDPEDHKRQVRPQASRCRGSGVGARQQRERAHHPHHNQRQARGRVDQPRARAPAIAGKPAGVGLRIHGTFPEPAVMFAAALGGHAMSMRALGGRRC